MADEQIVQNQGTQEQPAPEQGMPAEFGTPNMDTEAIDDILGGSDRSLQGVDIFPEPEAVTDSPEPVANTEEANSQTAPQANNEEVRYNYWQSEADKRKNELDSVKKTNEVLTNQLTALMQGNAQPQQQEQTAEQEEFPPPPDKPQRPLSFNREEAYTDPSSESAQYQNAVETWRDDMDEYNRLEREYNMALIQSERQEMETSQTKYREAQEQQAREQEQMTEMRNQARQQFNASDQDFNDYVKMMSDPQSMSFENTWRLFQLNKGQSVQPAAQPAPSAAFQQTRKAQSIPSSMGVLPSQNTNVEQKSAGDKLMDSIIADNDRFNII